MHGGQHDACQPPLPRTTSMRLRLLTRFRPMSRGIGSCLSLQGRAVSPHGSGGRRPDRATWRNRPKGSVRRGGEGAEEKEERNRPTCATPMSGILAQEEEEEEPSDVRDADERHTGSGRPRSLRPSGRRPARGSLLRRTTDARVPRSPEEEEPSDVRDADERHTGSGRPRSLRPSGRRPARGSLLRRTTDARVPRSPIRSSSPEQTAGHHRPLPRRVRGPSSGVWVSGVGRPRDASRRVWVDPDAGRAR